MLRVSVMEEKWSKLDHMEISIMTCERTWMVVATGLAGDAIEEDEEKFRTLQPKAFSTIVMPLSSSYVHICTS